MMEDNLAQDITSAVPEHPDNRLRDLILIESSKYVNDLWETYQLSTTQFRQKLNDYYKQYRGIPNRKNYDGLANVFVNETIEACEAIVAQEIHTIFSEPKLAMVQGREETDQPKAKLIENLLEYYFDIMGFKAKILRQIRQKNKYGTTIARISWCYEEKDITQRTPMGLASAKKITKNHPDLEYIDLLDVAVDPGKPDIDKMDWVIVRKRCSWDYVKSRERNGLYSSQQVAKMSSGAGRPGWARDRSHQNLQAVGINYTSFEDDTYEILEMWGKMPRWWLDDHIDINDPVAGEMVEGVCEVVVNGPTLRVERNPYWHQEKPFLLGQFIQIDDEAFGMGVCEITEALQMELNDKRNQLLDHATEQIAPPLLINRQAGIDDAQVKLRPFQKIKTDLPGDQAITPMRLGGNPMENVTMDSIIKQDIRNQTGATNPVQGVSSNKDQTAYEISTLQQRGSARIDVATIDFSEKFLKRCFRLMYAMIQQYLDRETVVRIVGKDGIRWETVAPEDVACDYDIIPKVATDVDNRTVIRNQMIQFVTQLAPIYPRTNVYKLVRKIYDLFGFEDGDQVVPEPDLERGQHDLTMEQEIQVLAMGQKIDVNYYDDHMSKINMLMKFMQQYGGQMTPQAKAAIQDNLNQHINYLKVLEQAQALAGAAPGGVLPAGPGGQPVAGTNARRPRNQTPVAQNAQAQRNLHNGG